MGIAVVKAEKAVFRNAKYYNHDFSGQNFSYCDFRGASLMGCKFNDCDLSYTNFEGANLRGAEIVGARCYRTNFKDASLAGARFEPKDAFGVTMTMNCETYDGMRPAKLWWYMVLMLLLLTKPDDPQMELDLIKAIGPERYDGLRTIMQRRVF